MPTFPSEGFRTSHAFHQHADAFRSKPGFAAQGFLPEILMAVHLQLHGLSGFLCRSKLWKGEGVPPCSDLSLSDAIGVHAAQDDQTSKPANTMLGSFRVHACIALLASFGMCC